MFTCFKIASVGVLVTLLGNEFHNETVLEQRSISLCEQRLEVTNSTMVGYKKGWEGVRLYAILNMQVLSLCSSERV